MTTTFYAPPEAFRGDWVVLPEEEARHAGKVLRARPGDEVVVVDGVGGWHRVRLEQVDKRTAAGTVLAARRDVGEPPYHLTLGLALLKNPNRYETFLEKAVELGVGRIVPLVTARTEKGRLKAARAEHILVAALKQCGRSRLPHLDEPTAFEDVLREAADVRLLCHEAEEDATLLRVLGEPSTAMRLHVLVGPEGGFTDEEVAVAQAAGYRVVSLGARRLRAETAALAAAAGVALWADAGG